MRVEETSQPIIDSHVHLWHPQRRRYAWLEPLPGLKRAFLPQDFRAAIATVRIEKFIFVEGGAEAGQGWEEAEWAGKLAESEPLLKGIVAQSTLAPDELEKLALNPLVKGVRPSLMKEINADGLTLLAQLGLSCDLCIDHPQLPDVIDLVSHHPDVMFILDHCGKPAIRAQVFEPWSQHLKALAALPNVCCKLSGLTTEADHWNWHPSHLQPYITHVVECFGFDRVLFGSDWPVATLATDYSRWTKTVRQALSSASATELKKVFHDNAERIYRV